MSTKLTASALFTAAVMLAALPTFNLKLGARTAPPKTSPPHRKGPGVKPAGGIPPSSIHERFATFLAGDGFKSSLLVENFRTDISITVTPALLSATGEVPMDSMTLAPHSTATLDISAFLLAHGYSDKQGTAVVRYTSDSYGPINAAVQSSDETHHLYLNSYAASPEEYWSGTAFDAVIWTPQAGTQGLISVTNTSATSRVVRTTFLVNGSSEQRTIQVAPRHTSILTIDDVVARSQKTGAGIHVEFDEYPGDILLEGQLFNKRTGFAKHIHFLDKALKFPTGTLRTHFMLLGPQPAEDGFPPNVSFRSVAAVRNIDSSPVTVAPTVKFLQNGSVQTVTLPSLELGVGESRLIDFSNEQRIGHLPSAFYQGSLELAPDTGKPSIVGELFNFGGEYGGYVVGPSFSSYPSHGTGSIWRTDGTFQTTVIVENTAAQEDQVSLNLSSDKGPYNKIFSIPAGGLLKINLRDLQQKAVPDKDGNLLLGTSGVASITSIHNTPSKLSIDKIIHSANESDYVGLPPNPCDYVTGISLSVDTSSGTGNTFPVIASWNWAQSGAVDQPASYADSSNTNLAQITGSPNGPMVTFTPPDDGQEHEVLITSPPIVTTDCDACSSGDIYVVADDTFLSVHHTLYSFSSALNGVCTYKVYCPTSPHICGPDAVTAAAPCPSTYLYTSWLKVRVGIYSVCLPGQALNTNTQLPCN